MSQLMYRENLLDHYKNPRNFGHLENYDFKHKADNPLCGDEVELEVKFNTQSGEEVVQEIKFSGHGCAISQAAASMMTEFLNGKNLEEVKVFSREDMLSLLRAEITPMRLKCALLGWNVLRKILETKNGIKN